MGLQDKANNKIQWLAGQARELAGRVTGNRSQQAKGHRGQAKANLKDAGEKIKDTFKP